MVYTIRKFRVFMVVAAILIISTYLYIDKPYSNYDINHIKEIDNKKVSYVYYCQKKKKKISVLFTLNLKNNITFPPLC